MSTVNPTKDQIGSAVEQACFYVTPMGTWLRIQWVSVEGKKFCVENEDTGDEFVYAFSEINEENPHFEKLVRINF